MKRCFFSMVTLLLLAGIVMFSTCIEPDTPTPAVKYDLTVTQPASGGTFTVEVGNAAAVSANTEAAKGQIITLTAAPESGFDFTGFTLNPSQTLIGAGNIRAFTMPAESVSVTAVFTAQDAPKYKITVNQPAEGGTFTVAVGSGAAVSTNTEAAEGVTITLSAAPVAGFDFSGFTVDPAQTLSGTGNTQTFTMPAEALTVSAVFTGPNTPANTRYILFTSDAHNQTGRTMIFNTWMPLMQQIVPNVDYFIWNGDNGDGSSTTAPAYWGYVNELINWANVYVDNGFIKNRNIFLLGNHDWQTNGGNYGANANNYPAAQQMVTAHEKVIEDDYIIYCLSATTDVQSYAPSDITTLDTYLSTAPSDIPIFVIGHYPLHYWYSLGWGQKRTTANAGSLINVLNKYSNVYFLWGHTHSITDPKDPHYDGIYRPGSGLVIVENGPEVIIQFPYLAAGVMSDTEYSGSGQHRGKALLVTLEDGNVGLKYIDIDGIPFDPDERGP